MDDRPSFEWDAEANQPKHGVAFAAAQYAFTDPKRVILEDVTHSTTEETRYFVWVKWVTGL